MTELSAYLFGSSKVRTEPDRESVVTTALSGLLIIGLPTVFWMCLLELANYALSLGISNVTRLIVASVLLGVLGLIWCFLLVCARQRRAVERLNRHRETV